MKLTTPAFDSEGPIPAKFARDGDNVSPALDWTGAPEGTRAFALICEDPDAPGGSFIHWLIYDIPGTAKGLPEGVARHAKLPGGQHQGINDFRRVGYDGPQPPSGPYHRYYFRLYALSEALSLPPKVSVSELRRDMEGKVLATAEVMGRFRKVEAAGFARMRR